MTNLEYFVNKYHNRDLLFDTNLLIVLLAGYTDELFISKVKATRTYTKEDFYLLKKLTQHFRIATTPHILTEASNLCEKAEKYYKEKIFHTFSQTTITLLEIQTPSKAVTSTPVFLKFGLTDSVIFKLAKEGLIILTDDFDLHGYLIGNGATAANMNRFRSDYLIE